VGCIKVKRIKVEVVTMKKKERTIKAHWPVSDVVLLNVTHFGGFVVLQTWLASPFMYAVQYYGSSKEKDREALSDVQIANVVPFVYFQIACNC